MLPVLSATARARCRSCWAGVIPAAIGALAGVLLGVSATAYWASARSPRSAAFLSGFEHQDGWGGADRGLVAGFIYGVALLVAHAIAGTDAKVSLGNFPPLLAVVTAIFGMLLTRGGRATRPDAARARGRALGHCGPKPPEPAEPDAAPGASTDRPVTR